MGQLFLDSGSFSLLTKAAKFAKATNKKDKWKFYDSKEFWEYMNCYVEFVKKYEDVIDLYANIDAIGNGELTYRNQKYLEKKGLKPVPVFHQATDFKYLRCYLDEGYDIIALGGMVGTGYVAQLRGWLDECFSLICDTPDRLPKVRVHGFGLTGFKNLITYPWWSVDSATWTKVGAFGGIIVPRYIGGKWNFMKPPHNYIVSDESVKHNEGVNYKSMGQKGKAIVHKWLDEIGVPFGTQDKMLDENGKEVLVNPGVCSRHSERKVANLIYFERFREALPEYPWPWTPKAFKMKDGRDVKLSKGFGVV